MCVCVYNTHTHHLIVLILEERRPRYSPDAPLWSLVVQIVCACWPAPPKCLGILNSF